MEFVQSVKRNMTTGAYAQITGRASRSEYWWFVLFTTIVTAAAGALDVLFPGDLLQSLFGIALLLRLRLSLWGAVALAVLFVVQVGLALHFLGDEAGTIATLTWLAWAYLALAAMLFIANARSLGHLLRGGLSASHPETHPASDPERGGT